MTLTRRRFLKSAAAAGFAPGMALGWIAGLTADRGELLYNGVRLAVPWPPQNRSENTTPLRPPYLADPPPVIPIDVGRQLFVDDFLIQETTLVRQFHQAAYDARCPILRPETAWEKFDAVADRTHTRPNPAAMVFSDGVFFDPAARLFKMWYMGGYGGSTCYAQSEDGVAWNRPSLDVVAGTNIVMKGPRDSSTVWLDLGADAASRFKLSIYEDGVLRRFVSADGIHWSPRGVAGNAGDRSTFFYNAFRKRWIFSLRDDVMNRRRRRYWEAERFEAASWNPGEPPIWVSADTADPKRPDYGAPPELYNLDAVAYESVLLGLFTIWRGEREDREKPNDVCVGFSRDGFHWDRTNRAPLVPVSEHSGDWNWANVQSAGGCCLVVGDELYFYVSGRQGVPGTSLPGVCSTGLARLRRDGFASMEPPARTPIHRVDPELPPGALVTRPVVFAGAHLFVNADLGDGQLRVEVESVDGRPIEPFALFECVPVTGNATKLAVRWRRAADLASVAGQPVRFRFSMTAGRLYAFWVSRSTAGASGGYLGAGAPGRRGIVDEA